MTAVPALPSYVSGVSEVPLLGDTIGDNFDHTVARYGGREALVDRPSGRRWTYSQLRVEVDAMAHGLLAAGIGKGDRVGIWAPNCPEWLLTQYATAKIGAILVTINPAYQTRELEYVLNQAGIRMLVAVESYKDSDYAAMISEVRPRRAALQRVVLIGSAEWDALPVPDSDASLLADKQATLSPDDPINIQYTSGTTGFPKGATLSHHNRCRRSSRRRPCRPSRRSGVARSMGCPRCSSPCLSLESSPMTCRRCVPGSWRVRRVRWR